MGKGQYENTKGMSIKDVYYTKFIPMLMDKIGDADEYQRIYDKVLKKGRYIERSYKGENLSSIIPEWLGHPSNKIANIEILFKDWYNGDGFEEDFNIMMGIYKDDEKAISIKDEYLKTHPYVKSCIEEEEEKAKQQESTEQSKEIESIAAYTPTATILPTNPKLDPVVQSMGNNIPEQNVFNSSVSKEDGDKERVTFNSNFFEDNRTQEPVNEASFIQHFADGRVVYPDGTVMIDPNVLLANRNVYPPAPMTPEQAASLMSTVQVQYGGIPYVPEFVNVENGINETVTVEAPNNTTPAIQPETVAPEFIIDNRILPQDDGKIPYCEYVMDSGSVLDARTKFNNDDVFIPASKTATGLIKRKKVIKEIYGRTGMTAALFSFKYIHNQNQFGIWMCTCNDTWLTIDYCNGAYSFTEQVMHR